MKANELRIGNYVSFNNFIQPQRAVVVDGKFLLPFNKTDLEINNYYQPIPLKEEWLLKFGFEKESNKSYSTGEEIVYSVYRLDELTYNSIQKNWWFNGVLSNQPIYVHQLQNLYHALTNEELTLIK